MRLVQRHGRIDRIGSRHQRVYLRTYFPHRESGRHSQAREPVTYEVVEQTSGKSPNFTAVAGWQTAPPVPSWAARVVTSADFGSGASVQSGHTLSTHASPPDDQTGAPT